LCVQLRRHALLFSQSLPSSHDSANGGAKLMT
jgi:hypothetical protein